MEVTKSLEHGHNDIASSVTKPNILSASESASIMRRMLSTIELEELIHKYYEIVKSKLPSSSIRLSFAGQTLRTGVQEQRTRTMKISILYGHAFGTPQHAQLSYSFSSVLSPVQRTLLSEIHSIFAMSLKHALEYYRVAQLATKDVLTGLGNRTQYMDVVKKVISSAERQHRDFGLLVFDLDNFKRVNDNLGHQEGDRVLVVFAQLLENCLRESDHAFRFGGDEFCSLLLDSYPSCINTVAQRIMTVVNEHSLFQEYNVTVSVGSTTFVETDSPESIFARADKALIEAKKLGKNQIKAA